jgi:hypothetical protein
VRSQAETTVWNDVWLEVTAIELNTEDHKLHMRARRTDALNRMGMRQTTWIGVKVHFKRLFGSLKNLVTGGALCEVLRNLALDRRREAPFEIVANQPDCFLTIHKLPLPR